MKAIGNAWRARFGTTAPDQALRLMTAHLGIESGWGKAGYCYNLGNMRVAKNSGQDYMYISGNELINGKWVQFSGDKPSELSKFRAFRTLQGFADAFVEYFASPRRKPVLAVLEASGTPIEYAKALKDVGYYTAPLDTYTQRYLPCYKAVEPIPIPALGPVEGYPTLEPDPEGDPLLRTKPPTEAHEPAPSPAAPAKPATATPGDAHLQDAAIASAASGNERTVLAKAMLRPRAVTATHRLPRIRIGAPEKTSEPLPPDERTVLAKAMLRPRAVTATDPLPRIRIGPPDAVRATAPTGGPTQGGTTERITPAGGRVVVAIAMLRPRASDATDPLPCIRIGAPETISKDAASHAGVSAAGQVRFME